MTFPTIGFIGLGAMGRSMAMRLRGAGFDLVVCDTDPAALAWFVDQGVATVATPRDVADHAGIVFACLPSPAASRAVAIGREGVALGRAIEIYVECSTIGSEAVSEIANALSERGIAVLDSPITGGPSGALEGRLTMIVAGDAAALDRVRPALAPMATRVVHVSPRPGLAQIAKLVNNMLSAAGTLAAFEGMVLGTKAGLDPEVLLEVINNGTGRNAATLDKFPAAILPRTFGGQLALGRKDLRLFAEEAERLGVPIAIAPGLAAIYAEAAEAGIVETLRIIELMEARAGGIAVKRASVPE